MNSVSGSDSKLIILDETLATRAEMNYAFTTMFENGKITL